MPSLAYRTDTIRLDATGLPDAVRDLLAPPLLTEDGFLVVEGIVGRSGVLDYPMGDGSVRREYRPAEEAFRADSIASYEGKPLVDQADGGHRAEVTPTKNTHLIKGAVLFATPLPEHGLVKARVSIHDAQVIARVQAGATALSLGYTVRLDATPGTTPDGERYDAIQRDVKINHLSRVRRGRAGDIARFRMDGDDLVPDTPQQQEAAVANVKLRLDGQTVDVDQSSVVTIEAVSQKLERYDSIVAERDELKGRVAALESAPKPNITELVQQRAALVAEATPMLKDGQRLDAAGMEPRALMLAAITNKRPDLAKRLDSASEDEVRGVFTVLAADVSKGKDNAATARKIAGDVTSPRLDADDAPKVSKAQQRLAEARAKQTNRLRGQ